MHAGMTDQPTGDRAHRQQHNSVRPANSQPAPDRTVASASRAFQSNRCCLLGLLPPVNCSSTSTSTGSTPVFLRPRRARSQAAPNPSSRATRALAARCSARQPPDPPPPPPSPPLLARPPAWVATVPSLPPPGMAGAACHCRLSRPRVRLLSSTALLRPPPSCRWVCSIWCHVLFRI